MLRKWCIPVATLALVGGSTLAATGVAAASTAAHSPGRVTMQPGGPARHPVGPLRAEGRGSHSVTSSNWSGYAATGGTGAFSSVSASWVEPTGHCTSGSQYSAFWVGLDGYSSSSVEQTGTEVDCSGSTPIYNAWWEMYPGPSHNFSNTVRPGDNFTASVTFDGSGKFTLKISDTTRGWSHTENKTLSSAKRSSAEVIVEAPCCTAGGGILPLANFGTANFTNSTANGSAIGNFSPTEIIMQSGGTQKDSISALSGGTNFSATWLHR
jgi:Peptidase A4 family